MVRSKNRHWHNHAYVLLLQEEISVMGLTNFARPATIDDPKGAYVKCADCGKTIPIKIIKTWDIPGTI